MMQSARLRRRSWPRPFLLLWAGQSVSMAGSEMTVLALPLTAVIALNASAVEVGLLRAAHSMPFLVFGLVIGAWVDRYRLKPVLVSADLGRALVLMSIPLAAIAGHLSLTQLVLAAALMGTLKVFFDLAYLSYLPTIIGRADLVHAHTRLESSRSLAQMAGPGAAGIVIQVFGAPVALAIDAFSFLVSSLTMMPLPNPDVRAPRRQGFAEEIREGVRMVVRSRLLRAVAMASATQNFFYQMFFTVYLLYATRDLGLSPWVFGTVLAAGGPAALLGSLWASRLTAGIGLGRALTVAAATHGLSGLVVLGARGPDGVSLAVLVLAQCLHSGSLQVYNITQVSLRQAVTPPELQARMHATIRVAGRGAMPLGALLGGILGSVLETRHTLAIAAVGMLAAFVWLWRSPVWRVRDLNAAGPVVSRAETAAEPRRNL